MLGFNSHFWGLTLCCDVLSHYMDVNLSYHCSGSSAGFPASSPIPVNIPGKAEGDGTVSGFLPPVWDSDGVAHSLRTFGE